MENANSPQVSACANHPSVAAQWQCRACRGLFCNDCINIQSLSAGAKLENCRRCGGRCEPVGEAKEILHEKERRRTFFELFPGVFAYPFKGNGKILLVIGVIFFAMLKIMSFAPFTGFIVGLFGSGYFTAYMFKVLNTSAIGREEMPDWPDFSDWFSDILQPYFSVLLVTLLCFGPAFLFFWLSYQNSPRHTNDQERMQQQFESSKQYQDMKQAYEAMAQVSGGEFSDEEHPLVLPSFAKPQAEEDASLRRSRTVRFSVFFLLGMALSAVGFFYYPMALITAGLDTYIYFNPVLIISSIFRVPVPYLIACVLFCFVGFFNFLGRIITTLLPFAFLASRFSLALLAMMIQGFLSFYFITVWMRTLGIMYYANEEKLGWFEVE